MEDQKVTADEIKGMLAEEIEQLAERMAKAMNAARAGSIIDDSEEPVRYAHAKFRQQAYEKLLSLLQQKQEAFSPSADGDAEPGASEGNASDE